jgi:hypothetical protein
MTMPPAEDDEEPNTKRPESGCHDGILAQRRLHLTRHKISCGEPERRTMEPKIPMANT